MFKEHNGGRKRSANHLSVVRDNRRWNSNLTGTSNGKFRTLRFYGRKLEPGEEKVVTYPYEICSIWFHKKDWKNIEMRSFWMTFASYPEKTVLYL